MNPHVSEPELEPSSTEIDLQEYNERMGEFLRTLIELGEEEQGIRSVEYDPSSDSFESD